VGRTTAQALVLCAVATVFSPIPADDPSEPVERLLRCSDIVVLASVSEKLKYGIVAGPGGMVHTRFRLKVERYYVGSGPEAVEVLIPGGLLKNPDGTETFMSIAYGGGAWGPSLMPGERFLAFLQVFAPAYRFVNIRNSQAMVTTDESSGRETVALTFGTVELLGTSAREKYEKLKSEIQNLSGEQRTIAANLLQYVLVEQVPVPDLPSRLEKTVAAIGGPKPPTTTCH